jgi:hypothetical protein
LVERDPSKVDVASSSLVSRSSRRPPPQPARANRLNEDVDRAVRHADPALADRSLALLVRDSAAQAARMGAGDECSEESGEGVVARVGALPRPLVGDKLTATSQGARSQRGDDV